MFTFPCIDSETFFINANIVFIILYGFYGISLNYERDSYEIIVADTRIFGYLKTAIYGGF